MDAMHAYRGHGYTQEDLALIRSLIASHPAASRRQLSLAVCAAWGWVQPNGAPRDAVCRGLLLSLERAGHIELPPPQWVARQPAVRHVPAAPRDVACDPIRCSLAALGPLEIRQVRRTGAETLCDGLIQQHHYLGYVQPVGEHLKYLVYAGERPVACFMFSSAPRHLGPRDRFIGWSAQARRQNVRCVLYNSRYLILPWVEVPHLASHLLGRMARRLPRDWQGHYGHPVYLLETFVDAGRYRGTCYRAANWIPVGQTTGRGKNDQTHRPNRSLKDVWVYPLVRDFRDRLARSE
jgi:hypothetical protein